MNDSQELIAAQIIDLGKKASLSYRIHLDSDMLIVISNLINLKCNNF